MSAPFTIVLQLWLVFCASQHKLVAVVIYPLTVLNSVVTVNQTETAAFVTCKCLRLHD